MEGQLVVVGLNSIRIRETQQRWALTGVLKYRVSDLQGYQSTNFNVDLVR
jgi:hypothetical protein